MPLTLNPPPTPVEPVTDVLHGVAVTDPYRWLEDQNSPRTRKWLEEQVTYCREYLDAIPGRERVRTRVEELLAVEVISEPWKVGDRYYYLKRAPYQEQPSIVMRESERGEEIPLVDSANKNPTRRTAVNILNISADGNLLAYSVRQGGEDYCAVEFIDVSTRKLLSDRLAPGFYRGVTFASDRRGFYYSHEAIAPGRSSRRVVLWHAFGSDTSQDTEVFSAGDDPMVQLVLLSSPSGKRLGYYKLFTADPRRADFLIHDVALGKRPQLIVEQIEAHFAPILLEHELFALTDWKAPNFRLVRIDLNSPESQNWDDVVPESDSRIQRAAVAGQSVLVTFVKNLCTHVEVFDFSGKNLGAISFPSKGTAFLFPCRPDTDTVFYRFSSFASPPLIFCHRTTSKKEEMWAPSEVKFDPSLFEIEQVRYSAKDGAEIPLFLVRRKGLGVTGPLPTFLTAYGGFGNSITPQFTTYATYLVEQGCLFALANVRGGAEFGESWHTAAKRRNRQTAIDDFIAAAECLVAQGLSVPDRLAIGGGSNGGLLVGAALTQKPGLFRAVICLGPLLDMLRYHLFDFANSWIDEYGSAELESDFHALLQYSPYHSLSDGTGYPAVLMISGDADTRCNPLHARKMAARLQAATTSNYPILLDYKSTWGHVPVQPLSSRIQALTDRLAFTLHELGVSV